jgi:hypothetical protein
VASQVEAEVTTTAPLGHLTINGNPDRSWRQSTQALNAANSALSLYFGALQMAEADDASEWAQTAPSVAFDAAAPLVGARVKANLRSVTPTLTIAGSTPTAASVTARVGLSGGGQPGTYDISMDAAVRDGSLVITSWTMTQV